MQAAVCSLIVNRLKTSKKGVISHLEAILPTCVIEYRMADEDPGETCSTENKPVCVCACMTVVLEVFSATG